MTSAPGGPDPARRPDERPAERPAVVARRVGQDVSRQVGRHVTTAARRQGWRARTSAWLLLPVAGLPWVGFGYIAWKGRRPAWAGAAALHLGISAGAVTALVSGEWWTVLGVLAAGGGWGAGVLHGLTANPRWLRLQAERAPSPSAPWLRPLTGAAGSPSGAPRLLGPGAPTDPAERAALGQQEAAAALEVAVRAGTALPPAALPLVREVHDAALPLLARGAGRGLPLPALDLYEVEAVVGEHLPAALAQYLVLPPGYQPPPGGAGGAGTPSPAESLLAQLRSLVELLAEVTERVHEHDARQLRVQAAFLGDKVRRSDLEL